MEQTFLNNIIFEICMLSLIQILKIIADKIVLILCMPKNEYQQGRNYLQVFNTNI